MIQTMYTAKLALMSQQKRVDTIANNIANINTFGYKCSRVSFKDALYANMFRPTDGQSLQRGTGVLISATTRFFDDGTPISTGVKLDFCLEGAGFFTVRDGGGNISYTRNGTFAVSVEDGGNYLVTAQGYYVLDEDQNRIRLPDATDQLTVTPEGALSIGTAAPFARFGIASFENNEGLEAVSDNCYMPTEASGPARQEGNTTVKQGFLESSNVDLALEMTRLIRAQRAFSLASRAVVMGDEMDALANNLRT